MRGRKSLLSVTGALEAATGLVLLVAPSVLVELLNMMARKARRRREAEKRADRAP